MNTEIAVAIISGLLSLVGVILTVKQSNNLILYRLDQVEAKVEKLQEFHTKGA